MHHLTLFSWLSSLFFLFPWCVTSENNVLCDVYQSTSIGDRLETGHMTGWECFRGQPDAELCEDWSGVKCDRQGNVKYLDISGQNLTGNVSCDKTLPPPYFQNIEWFTWILMLIIDFYYRYFALITGKFGTLAATICGIQFFEWNHPHLLVKAGETLLSLSAEQQVCGDHSRWTQCTSQTEVITSRSQQPNRNDPFFSRSSDTLTDRPNSIWQPADWHAASLARQWWTSSEGPCGGLLLQPAARRDSRRVVSCTEYVFNC